MRNSLTILILFLLCHGHVMASEPIKAFVSIAPFKFIVDRIGGDAVISESFIGANSNPHSFSPSPRKFSQLENADVFFRSGSPSETRWVTKLQQTFTTLPFINLQQIHHSHSAEKIKHSSTDQGHIDHDEMDPHFWTDPLLMLEAAKIIKQALINLAPAHQSAFAAGFAALKLDLIALDQEIKQTLSHLENRAFMVFHPSWGYFAERYQLQQIPIEIAGRSPGPRTLIQLLEAARSKHIRVLLVQPQIHPGNLEVFANQLKLKIEMVDPLSYDFPATLRHIAAVLVDSHS